MSYGILFICASTLLIAGVSQSKKMLLVPWLIVTYFTLLCSVIIVIAFMISIADIYALAVLCLCAVPVLLGVYCWINVYTTYKQIMLESILRENDKYFANVP